LQVNNRYRNADTETQSDRKRKTERGTHKEKHRQRNANRETQRHLFKPPSVYSSTQPCMHSHIYLDIHSSTDSTVHTFIHSFIADIYIEPLQWYYSEAPPTPARPNNVVLSCWRNFWENKYSSKWPHPSIHPSICPTKSIHSRALFFIYTWPDSLQSIVFYPLRVCFVMTQQLALWRHCCYTI